MPSPRGNVDIHQLCVRAKEGSASARDQLVRRHMGMVVRIARGYYRPGAFMEIGDLIQQGCLGILHAVRKFDPTRRSRGRTIRFSTYAYYWIQHSIRREIETHGLTIAVPIGKIKTFKAQGSGDLGATLPRAYCLEPEAEWVEDRLGTAWARCVDLSDTSEVWCRAWENRRCVERLLTTLPPRKQQVLRCRYGLDGTYVEKTQKQVGELFQLSESRIGLIERASLLQLRREAPLIEV